MSNNMQNVNIQPRLQYHYAQIDPITYQCVACFTSSDMIPIPTEYILIPRASDDYLDKYYNPDDGLFYYDPEYTEVFTPTV